jgi:hypothetical protein
MMEDLSVMKRLLLVSTLAFIVALAGCGGGSGHIGGPPPTGGFSNANFSGTYSFIIVGANTGGFFTIAGSVTANGSGTITGGTVDINSPGTIGVLTNVSATGLYSVKADGRATASLVTTAGTFNFDFVILTAQRALVVRFDGNASASGSLDLQAASAANLTTLAGSFVFNLQGVDGPTQNVEASAGIFTIDTSGDITAGVQDTNRNGTLSTNAALTITGLAMSSPVNGRGTLMITTSADGTRHFVYYVISANQIRLIETDNGPVLAGDAFRQTSTAVSGSFAFTLSGRGSLGPLAAGGIINTDGAGNVLSTSVEDVNNGGSISQNVGLGGTYAIAGNGRGTMTSGTLHFAVYPSTGGIQVLEIDTSTVANGTAFQQTGTFSNGTVTGRYGLNTAGVIAPSATFDSVAQFMADGSGHLTGNLDLNRSGLLNTGLALNGTYALAANGRATGTLVSAAGTQNVIYYAASGMHILFIEIDNNAVAVGDIEQQP